MENTQKSHATQSFQKEERINELLSTGGVELAKRTAKTLENLNKTLEKFSGEHIADLLESYTKAPLETADTFLQDLNKNIKNGDVDISGVHLLI